MTQYYLKHNIREYFCSEYGCMCMCIVLIHTFFFLEQQPNIVQGKEVVKIKNVNEHKNDENHHFRNTEKFYTVSRIKPKEKQKLFYAKLLW